MTEKSQYTKLKEDLYFLRNPKLRRMAMGRSVSYEDIDSFLLGVCFMLYRLNESPPNPSKYRDEKNQFATEEEQIQGLLDFWGIITLEERNEKLWKQNV